MAASFVEFQMVLARFPHLAGLTQEEIARMYADFRKAEQDCLAEPMDYLKYGFFGKARTERRAFLTRRQYSALCSRVNDGLFVDHLEDKAAFYETFSPYLGRRWLAACDDAYPVFKDLCSNASAIVVKPRRGGYGRGVEIVSSEHAESIWASCLEESALVEEYIVQHETLSALYPKAVNCVRVATALHPDGRAEIVAAALRCGCNGAETDSGDSLCASIDLASGTVSSNGVSHFSERFDVHPDTGVRFEGLAIPRFEELLFTACTVAESVPALRLMNWDFACRSDGAWCLIEGNFAGGLGPCQEASGVGLKVRVNSMLGIDEGE